MAGLKATTAWTTGWLARAARLRLALAALGLAGAWPLSAAAQEAPGAPPKPFTFDVSANLWAGFGASDQDTRAPDARALPKSAFKQKATLRFNPEAVTDNGWILGASVAIASTNRNDSRFARRSLTPPEDRNVPYLDKQYLYAEGPFGYVAGGQVTGIGDQTAAYAPISNALTGINGSAMNVGLELAPSFFDPRRYVARPFTSTTNFANDSAKILYFTPRVLGLQLGASFTPAPDQGGFARAAANQRFNALAPADIDVDKLWGGRPFDNIDKAFEVGVNYDQTFGEFSVRGAFTYGGARDPRALPRREDTSAYSLGLNFSYGDLSLGGSYGYIQGAVLGRAALLGDPALNLIGGQKLERSSFDLGGTYAINDLTLGLNYAYGEGRYPTGLGSQVAYRAPSTAGTEFSFSYKAAHGVDLISALQFIAFDAGNLPGERAPNKSATNLLLGTQVKF